MSGNSKTRDPALMGPSPSFVRRGTRSQNMAEVRKILCDIYKENRPRNSLEPRNCMQIAEAARKLPLDARWVRIALFLISWECCLLSLLLLLSVVSCLSSRPRHDVWYLGII